jgi:hypothetical protein
LSTIKTIAKSFLFAKSNIADMALSFLI